MVPANIFNRDANVSLQRWRCKNLVVQISSNGYVMMQMLLVRMSWCKCPLVGMSWCECPFVGMPWCKCPLVGISWHKCFDANTIYSKIPFIFKTRLPQRLKPKHFQNLIYYSWKVIFFFWLKSLQKLVISIRKSPNEALTWNQIIWLKKIYFHNLVEQKGWLVSMVFWKNKLFENQAP